ncbi:glycosyl hydrolase family 16 [Coprinopsis cinerea okayama7|uniref:Glycosyl hydrolase family 16 n=1 Tax=Coprinopsis cinerea (strain Okayama-7 / 130 / ATCC MYA-4618 / FGSC 9003) TaxID=240176 RepID=A8PBB7_COPC7|nr:glycosyl hydrolase family 16 [Coprinopsis cinerea okayama7\|eukprot:XP_001840143.1 glycosyl hydrolase family 16 [Coprinopsis cinerea okayama7\
MASRVPLSFIQTFALLTLFAASFRFALAENDGHKGNVYFMSDNIQGAGFYNAFEWENIADPTHGRVNYVDMETSKQQNLTFAVDDKFILRADSTSFLDPNGPGRNSVRIRSWKTYTTHVAVFDVKHMPQGCGTWPAIWEVQGDNWPNGGEVDILEGVNDEGPNAATLHTSPGCRMPASRSDQRGIRVLDNCDATINSNIGCPVQFPTPQSYGPAFNEIGGGWYAMERSPTYIKIWFWARDDPSVPDEVKYAAGVVNPDHWGLPTAFFPDNQCNMNEHFGPHNIVINLTFCGDWAGQTYEQSGCPGTCVDFVNNNPSAFEKAFFDLRGIRVYQK